MTRKLKYKKLLYVLLTLFMLVLTIIGGRGVFPAFADTTSYTSVLVDLQKDSKFNVNKYPVNSSDYSINVIQIAESSDRELFIYTYQPSQNSKCNATSLNMSLSDDFLIIQDSDTASGGNNNSQSSSGSGSNLESESGVGSGFGGGGGHGRSVSAVSTRLYNLTLIDISGVFFKYKVDDFTVSSDAVRYYNITSIYREKISGIDKETGNDNTVSEIAYNVGQVWSVTPTSDGIKYEMKEVETIEITDKYVGTVSYKNGVSWFTTSACFGHFVAFSTNRQIDKLLEADVYYATQSFKKDLYGNVTVGEKEPQHVSLTSDQVAGNTVKGIFGKSYTWDRIQSAAEFLKSDVEFNAEVSKKISGQQWVLSFAEEEMTGNVGVLSSNIISLLGILFGSPLIEGTYVSDVSILRLKFITDGVTYNLGVVDNKQTGSNTPVGTGKFNFFEYVWSCVVKLFTGQASVVETIVAVIALAVALFVVAVVIWFCKMIFRLIFK